MPEGAKLVMPRKVDSLKVVEHLLVFPDLQYETAGYIVVQNVVSGGPWIMVVNGLHVPRGIARRIFSLRIPAARWIST